ncbi:MAG: protein kinase domain-containing protein [Planctomycetota bacterium]|jgi:serine/threonine protein kinase/WD40 repeat protein
MDSANVKKGFRKLYLAHQRNGEIMPLKAYQSAFSGFDELIAEEYARLQAEAPPLPEPPPEPEGESAEEERRLGHYSIESEIGRGGQGKVYLANDSHLDRKVALKVLGATYDRSYIERFKREAAAASRLEHPGICPVYDANEDGGTQFIAMRYIDGKSLQELIAAAQKDDPRHAMSEITSLGPSTRKHVESAVLMIEKVARALHVAHESGLVHRDIKPGNVMVDKQGEPVVLDFGLASDESGQLESLTVEGDLLGTPAYMSPEQLLAQRIKLDRRTDVYSLGVTLYECLTLRRPFEAPTREALYKQILTSELPDPTRINKQLGADLKVVIETACDKDRDRRYQTALDFAEDLRRVREFKPIRAKPLGPIIRFRRWTQRRPALATAVLASFLLLVVGLGISLYMLQEVRKREAETRATARYARALALAAESQEVVSANPLLALLLAREAVANQENARTRSALLGALASVRQVAEVRMDRRARTRAHKLPGDRLLCRVTGGSAVLLCDFDGNVIERYEGQGPVGLLVSSPDGERFITRHAQRKALLWRIGHPEPVPIGAEADYVYGGFSQDGTRIYTRDNKSSRLYDRDGRLLGELDGRYAIFAPDGQRILAYSHTDKVHVYDWDAKLVATLPVRYAGWSPDGQLLSAYTYKDGKIHERFLYTRDGQLVTNLEAQTVVVVRGAVPARFLCTPKEGESFLVDEHGKEIARFPGKYIYVAGREIPMCVTKHGNTVRLRDFDGKELASFEADSSRIIFRGDRLISWEGGESVLRDLSGKLLARFPQSSAFWEPGFVSGVSTSDNTMRVWDLDGLELAVCRGHEGTMYAGPLSDDGGRVLSTSVDGTVRIWEVASTSVPTLRGHQGPVAEAAFLAGGSRIVTRSHRGEVRATTDGKAGRARLFEASGKALGVLAHENVSDRRSPNLRGVTDPRLPSHMEAAPDGDRIATVAVASLTGRLWDSHGNQLSDFEDLPVYAIEFLGDGRIMTHTKPDPTHTGAYVWDRNGKNPVKLGVWERRSVQFRPRVSPKGDRMVTMSDEDGKARLLGRDGRELARLAHPGNARRVGPRAPYPRCWFLPGGDRFAMLSRLGKEPRPENDPHVLTVFDRDGKKIVEPVRYEQQASLVVSTAEQRLVSWQDATKVIHLWDADGKKLATLEHDGAVDDVKFANGGGRIFAFSGEAATAKIWDTDGNEIATVPDVTRAPRKVVWGDRILPLLGGITVPIWDRDGNVLAELRGHTRGVRDVDVSPDGRYIVTASADGTARVWDKDGAPVHVLRSGGSILTARFSPDGASILTTSSDHTSRVWPAAFEEAARRADAAAFREFSADERDRYADLLR